MRYSIAPLAVAALVAANPFPQSPSTPASSDCMSTYPGTFMIEIVNVTTSSKRAVEKRQSTALQLTLNDGVLKDEQNRVGEIVANHQFQFDPQPQTGAIYTSGWAVCSNGTLVLGSDAVFQECLSGNFYNIYNNAQAEQCSPIHIQVIQAGGDVSQAYDGQPAAASQMTDGQITASPVSSTAAVTQISDGQLQGATSAAAVTQITDGQIQGATSASAMPVSQITDGQIQGATSASAMPVSQISDGQLQGATSASAMPVSQISDGQLQGATTAAAVTQISDGQIQAPTTAAVVSQISDGQIQAPTNGTMVAYPSATVQPYTGAATLPSMRSELFGLAAGVLAIAML